MKEFGIESVQQGQRRAGGAVEQEIRLETRPATSRRCQGSGWLIKNQFQSTSPSSSFDY